ncbi:hypothetical protein J5N97_009011 [Dioscorea zingiberensis]|uniref:SART-1 family protein DOT2 n=1 Tax=Dioscorea zingiberensis TaxID=325984 RepID=A0A9D5CWA8_9LILI|nr:hypothetical protein J5N97_009011 [Dioscorea zingiberensis]
MENIEPRVPSLLAVSLSSARLAVSPPLPHIVPRFIGSFSLISASRSNFCIQFFWLPSLGEVEMSDMRMEVDGEARVRKASVEREGRDGRVGDHEENGSVDQDYDGELGRKDRSRESGKQRIKDRKRRREEKEHGSQDRDRSREREREDKLDGRERRKDDREYEKDRDKVRERDYDRDMHKGKERDREMDRNYDEEHDRGKAQESDRGRERKVERDRDLPREYERDKNRERDRDGDRMHDRSKGRDKDHGKENERELERERGKEKDRDRGKDKEREREKDRDRVRDREREKEKSRDREKVKDRGKAGERDKPERTKNKERAREKEIDKETDRDKSRPKDREREMDRSKNGQKDEKSTAEDGDGKSVLMKEDGAQDDHERIASRVPGEKSSELPEATSELAERLMKMKEERLKRTSDSSSEISSWLYKSRKLEKRNAEEEKVARRSKILDEQESGLAESDDEDAAGHSGKDLAGVKILHGLDKVMEGGAVVLTLKDQNILADGDLNEEVDMLENVEIGEQKKRDDAYKAAKKTTGIYYDKFSDNTGSQRPILPQYDDPVEDEGVTLDESGRFTGEAEKKLEELRKRIEGGLTSKSYEDLTLSGKFSSDYYTPEEMLQFKKPKKKKALRKKDKLDLDALEAEARSAGLGASDLGSRNDSKRLAAKEEQEKSKAASRSEAYQTAYAKAEEASKVLRQGSTLVVKASEEDDLVFGEDYEDLQKSLEQSRKLALKRQDEAVASGPLAVSLLAATNKEQNEIQSPAAEPLENKVVITEMEEFVLGLQLNEESHKPESDSVFMDEDDGTKSSEREVKDTGGGGGWEDAKESIEDELHANEEKEDITPDEIIHETAVGKGLSGALKLLKERGSLKEDIDWGGRNMDKKKSKLVGINDNAGPKEIRIERTDEFGRVMTPKEAFRMISHKFHGKGPGKMKQEKRMKNYQMDLQTKQMQASDTPSQTMERMREAQARLKTPYLVLSGHVKPGQTSDPRSGFATVEKNHLGSLTPMLGDKKVEHFLGINRKFDSGSMGPPPPKKPKN